MRPTKTLAIGFLLLLAVVSRAAADVTVRECITPGVGPDQAYLLPPSSGWKMLGSLRFNHQTPSDYFVNVMVNFSEANTPNTRVEYQMVLDGTPHGWYTRRVPKSFPRSQVLSTVISNVSGGIHTLGIRARNLGSANVYYSRFWISPLLVESSEVTGFNTITTPVTVGSSWTTLAQTAVSVGASRYAYLSGFATVVGGTTGASFQYRFVRDTTQLDDLSDTMPDEMPDGMHIAFIDRFPVSGANIYKLEARSTSGSSSVTFGSRSLSAQTIPNFTVFEASSLANSIPSDDQWHPLASTPWLQISPESIGIWGTSGYGFSHFTSTGPLEFEAQVKFELEFQTGGSKWEVGIVGVTPFGQTKLEATMSDWEQLGLKTTDYYRMTLQARGLCQPMSSNLSFQKTRFQVLVLADNNAYSSFNCSKSPLSCCANNPDCLAYECTASGELLLVSVPPRDCS